MFFAPFSGIVGSEFPFGSKTQNPFLPHQGHQDYINCDNPLSPWRVLPGWHLGSCFHDPMHVMYLGICKDLYASALGYWIRMGFYGVDEGSLSDKLRKFSMELKEESRRQKYLWLKLVKVIYT